MSKHIDYDEEAKKRVWWLNNTGGAARDGLTVRDYFAAEIMAAFAAKEVVSGNAEEFASTAYYVADAMMKERAK